MAQTGSERARGRTKKQGDPAMISERFWLSAQHTLRYRDRTEARSQWLRRFSREKRDDMHTAGAKSTLRSCDEPRRSRFRGDGSRCAAAEARVGVYVCPAASSNAGTAAWVPRAGQRNESGMSASSACSCVRQPESSIAHTLRAPQGSPSCRRRENKSCTRAQLRCKQIPRRSSADFVPIPAFITSGEEESSKPLSAALRTMLAHPARLGDPKNLPSPLHQSGMQSR